MKKVFNWIDKKLDKYIDISMFYLEMWKWERKKRKEPLIVGLEEEDLICDVCGNTMWVNVKKDGYQSGFCLMCEKW